MFIIIFVEGLNGVGKSRFLETIDTIIASSSPSNKELDVAHIYISTESKPLILIGDGFHSYGAELTENKFCEYAWATIVIIDPAHIELDEHLIYSFNFIKHHNLPYVVAINERKDSKKVTVAEVRTSLRLDDNIPILYCNANDDKVSCLRVVLKCLELFPESESTLSVVEHMKQYIEDIQKQLSKNQS